MKFETCGLEQLHRHSDFSLLDGLATVEEYAEYSKAVNQNYLCITDHGMMGVIPRQIRACDKHGLKPLFGIEAYINNEQPSITTEAEYKKHVATLLEEEQKRLRKSHHLLMIASNDAGYANLVTLSSWAFEFGYGGVPRQPRLTHDQLTKHKEGIIFSSCCYLGEIGYAFEHHGRDAAEDMLQKYLAMFGENFYLEIMLLDFKKQKPYDVWLISMHDKYHIPLIVTQDCLVAGTLVSTKRGLIPIEEIVVGDLVLTHRNRYRKVEVVGKRRAKNQEYICRVRTKAGTYAYESTHLHKMWVATRSGEDWEFDWKPTERIDSLVDHLVVPKIPQHMVFCDDALTHIDVMDFLEETSFQIGSSYQSSQSGNMGCRLQFNEASQEFRSYRGWDRSCETVIPRRLVVDDDFLKVLGWYIAEGWSDRGSNQVGFALHLGEQHIADWLISYFSQYGIKAKSYQVTEKGIAVRFSSVVFNRLFSKMCGSGATNKHLPDPDGSGFLRSWSKEQLVIMLRSYWEGDGRELTSSGFSFDSTSRKLIFEIATVLNAFGLFAYPSVASPQNESWSDNWCVALSGERGREFQRLIEHGICSPASHKHVVDLDSYWLVPIKRIEEIAYDGFVYDLQVEEDHSFTANLVVSSNCHYCKKEDAKYQQYMLMTRTKNTVHDIEKAKQQGGAEERFFELQDTNLWMKSEDELNEKWFLDYQDAIPYELFCDAKRNTVEVCRKAEGVEIDRSIKLPQLSDANARLLEAMGKGMKWRGLWGKPNYMNQLKEEYELICRKDFSSYFLITKKITDEARRICPKILGWGTGGEAIGPGRGSAVGFLTCFVLGITDVDPIKHDLLPERFLSDARGGRQLKLEFESEPIS